MASTITAGNATNGLAMSSDSTGILSVKTGTGSGTTAMTIDASQNVGIGTTTPSAYANYTTLTINGTDVDIDLLRSGTRQFGLYTTSALTAINNVANLPLAFYTNNAERMRLDTSGNLQFNSGYGSVATAYGCRAWVNFNGTGTVAIRASGNVTSITDNGTGNYTVNFTNAMPDTNYCAIAESAISTANTANDTIAQSTVSASSSVVFTNNPVNAAAVDSALVHVAIFR